MMEQDLSAEQKIKDAARKIFLEFGFDGCTTRQIAKEAGINVALVNYYFRSKNQLFQLVFKAVMEDFLKSMLEVFRTDLSLENKVRIFIEREFEFLAKHPDIPMFVINEMTKKQGCFVSEIGIVEQLAATGVFQESLKAQAEGRMRKIDMVSVMILLKANCHFPFMAKSLIQDLHKLSDESYQQQLTLHKQYVTEMIVGYLFPQK